MLLNHLGTGALIRARLVQAGFFAAPIPLTALVPVFALTGRRVDIAFATFFLLIPFLYHLFLTLPLVGGKVWGRGNLTSGFTLRLERRGVT